MATKKKTKNKNYYKAGKVQGLMWKANVTNDESKTVATLSFTKDFNQAARDLKSVAAKLNKEMKNVKKQIRRIEKDEKTGELLKGALTSQYDSFKTVHTTFSNAVSALYNGAIDEYNNWLQSMYEELSTSKITNRGTATVADKENIEQSVDTAE